jgi:hypothetical protein
MTAESQSSTFLDYRVQATEGKMGKSAAVIAVFVALTPLGVSVSYSAELTRDAAAQQARPVIEGQRILVEVPLDFATGVACGFTSEQTAVQYAARISANDQAVKAGLASDIVVKRLIRSQSFQKPYGGSDCATGHQYSLVWHKAVLSRQLRPEIASQKVTTKTVNSQFAETVYGAQIQVGAGQTTPVTVPMETAVLLRAKQRFIGVTGITGQGAVVQAQVQWTVEPTAVGKAMGDVSSEHTGYLTFQLFDDGWRLMH